MTLAELLAAHDQMVASGGEPFIFSAAEFDLMVALPEPNPPCNSCQQESQYMVETGPTSVFSTQCERCYRALVGMGVVRDACAI